MLADTSALTFRLRARSDAEVSQMGRRPEVLHDFLTCANASFGASCHIERGAIRNKSCNGSVTQRESE